MNKLLFSVFTVILLGGAAYAQEESPVTPDGQDTTETVVPSKWSVGIGFGPRLNFMKFTEMSSKVGGTKKMRSSYNFSIFAYREFRDGKYAIRPQLSLMSRGAKYTGLQSNNWDNADYTVAAKYFDFRMPLILNIGDNGQPLQPYLYLSPLVGFVRGGEITIEEQGGEEPAKAVLNLSKANMSALYVGAGLGFGLRYKFMILGEKCFAGAEVMYDYGITDTYGKTEKKSGGVTDVGGFVNYTGYAMEGRRNFSGLEIQAVAAIPLSIFKHKRKKPEPAPPVEEPPVVEEEPPQEKPCYELDEIIALISDGESVLGKTICAVNTITFDFGSAVIKPESYDYLDNLAQILKRTGADIKVNGHTDNKGTDALNLKLSTDRAKAVVDYLADKGIDREKLSYEGFGPHRPIADNATEEGRAINRRVEFEILDNKSQNTENE